MTRQTEIPLRIRASFRPSGDLIPLLSQLVGDVCRLELHDPDIGDRFRMAAHELGENIAKYSTGAEVSLEFEVVEDGERYVLSVRTKNRASPERLRDVGRRLSEITSDSDPDALYDRLLERSLGMNGVSGLGLVRIRAEVGELVYSIEGEELTVAVTAVVARPAPRPSLSEQTPTLDPSLEPPVRTLDPRAQR